MTISPLLSTVVAFLGIVLCRGAASPLQQRSSPFQAEQHTLSKRVERSSRHVYHDHMVEMSDGTKLFTKTILPDEPGDGTKYTAVLIRTPYGSGTLEDEGIFWVEQGFAVVMQDFRGRFESEGDFSGWTFATSDGGDTIRWITKQPWSSGHVFSQGESANGIAAYLQQADKTLAGTLLAQYVLIASADLYPMIYQGGAYRHSMMNGWLNGIGEQGFEPVFVEHEAYGPAWEPVSMVDKWSTGVAAPGVHVTGWYDVFSQGQIDAYESLRGTKRPQHDLNFLVMAPTGHCPGGQVAWPKGDDGGEIGDILATTMFKLLAATAENDPTLEVDAIYGLVADAFNEKGVEKVLYYVMGPSGSKGAPGASDSGPFGNYWASGSRLAAGEDTSFYLSNNMDIMAAVGGESAGISYLYDPQDPVPTFGGNNLLLPECGPQDQGAFAERTDVISFVSEPLQDIMLVSGRMRAELFVSSNCSDTDFTVKILDIYPDGAAMLVQDGIVRMRWANDSRTPRMMTPSQVYRTEIDVWSTAYIFNAGHRIGVDISSSNYPRFSANPNTGDLLDENSLDSEVANNTVWVGPDHPSRLILPVVPVDLIPEETNLDQFHERIVDVLSQSSGTVPMSCRALALGTFLTLLYFAAL